MGFLSDAYRWIDANVAGGLLPGGHPLAEPGATIAGVVPTPFVGIQPAATAPAAALPPAVRPVAGLAPLARPGVPGMCVPRGKIVTMVAKRLPDGTTIPLRAMPGSPALMSSDVAAVKRVKRVLKRFGSLIPKRRRTVSTKVVYRSRGTSKKK